MEKDNSEKIRESNKRKAEARKDKDWYKKYMKDQNEKKKGKYSSFYFRLNNVYDGELIEYLNGLSNRTETIRQALLEYQAKHKG